jgi:two-component system, OmpR family, sensor histidine kinase VicK
MTTIQMLTVRTSAALSRLASLQRRAERIAAPASAVVRPALRELTDALEELQVANDELQAQITELMHLKAAAVSAERRFAELLQLMPCATVWTTRAGEITEANPAAALLLNVSRQHLVGRALLLFVADRLGFEDALAQLAANQWSVDLEAEVRPRERRPRPVSLLGRRLDAEDHLCWFLIEKKPA